MYRIKCKTRRQIGKPGQRFIQLNFQCPCIDSTNAKFIRRGFAIDNSLSIINTRQRSKPGKQVEVGAQLRLWQGDDEREVIVRVLSEQRRGAPEAALLYEETAASLAKRAKMAEARRLNSLYAPHPETRPDKKQRRDLLRLKQGDLA